MEATVSRDPIVIVGAGLAGWSTVREVRKLDRDVPVVVVSADGAHFYAKPILSNALAQERRPDELITTSADEMAQTLGITLHAETEVESINIAARTVLLRNRHGRTKVLRYASLVLATGALPVAVPIDRAPDVARDAVFTINSLDDYRLFHSRLGEGRRRVLIIGAGLIGCEFANDLAAAGHGVHVIDPACRPLAAHLPEAASQALMSALGRLGVTWHFGQTVKRIAASERGAVTAVLSNGTELEADLVLGATGLRPDTRLAEAAGIRCARGIIVDECLETSAVGVYAIGDAAQYAFAGDVTLPYVMPILQAAKALGMTLAGQRKSVKFPVMPVSVKTPVLPVVVATPSPGVEGAWDCLPDGQGLAWGFFGPSGHLFGFALLGEQTARRAAVIKTIQT